MQYKEVISLFKYSGLEYGLETIKNNTIYCPTIDKLNDPFDSQIYFQRDVTKRAVIEYQDILNNMLNEKFNKINYDNKLKYINSDIHKFKEYFYKHFEDEKNDYITKYYRNDIDNIYLLNYGLYSMTTDNANILMWSHYSEKHKGVCIEWSREEGNEYSSIQNCFPIKYSSYVPEIEYKNLSVEEICKEKYGNKCDIWSYEKEWRFITQNCNNSIKINSNITCVYLGCKYDMKSKNSREIIKVCRDRNIRVKKAKMIEKEYRIEFIENDEL